MDPVLRDVHGFVGVPAEDPVGAMIVRMGEGSGGNLCRHAQPACIEPVDQTRDRLALEVEFLQLQIQRGSHPAQPESIHLKAVELVAVNRNVAEAAVLPGVLLVNTHANQVRHDVGQPVIVIAFDPHNFDAAFGIRELTNASQKLPVIFGEAGEVQVGEDVTEQDQALEAGFLENASSLARAARVRTQVQVGEDQRVVHGRIHT